MVVVGSRVRWVGPRAIAGEWWLVGVGREGGERRRELFLNVIFLLFYLNFQF